MDKYGDKYLYYTFTYVQEKQKYTNIWTGKLTIIERDLVVTSQLTGPNVASLFFVDSLIPDFKVAWFRIYSGSHFNFFHWKSPVKLSCYTLTVKESLAN